MASDSKELKHPRLMTADEREALPKHEKFTTEAQERRRARSDKPFYPRSIHFNTQASRDGIRHFVDGLGDTNPLFREREYAGRTKYGGIIAPGCYLYSIQWGAAGGGGPGIHGWYVGGDWEFYRPIHEGDEFTVVCVLRELVEKKGRMGGGKTWIDYGDVIYVNQRKEIVAKERGHFVLAERASAGSTGKSRGTPKPLHGKEDWRKILELYEREELRGAEIRWWEDVQTDEKLGPMIKGPLSVRDELAFIIGAGSPFFKAHKIEFDWERRHPKGLEYVKATGDVDIPELVHVFDWFAQEIGVERAYDYGSQRMSWMGQLFTNWMGDDGWLWKMSSDLRVFNLMGDITTYEGRVVKKYVEEGKCCVDIEAWAKNQRDEYSMPPHISTVILPSKESGLVIYPNPPSKLYEEAAKARPLDDMIREGII